MNNSTGTGNDRTTLHPITARNLDDNREFELFSIYPQKSPSKFTYLRQSY
ncbi:MULTISPECIES: hypothetical protein [unclassified Nostoc]|nr:hypothetical protein [Nostoc sp. 'Peltigera membranacea cyanobiont' 210A]